MKKVLLLFDQASIDANRAQPETLVHELRQFTSDTEFHAASYDDISFYMSNEKVTVTLVSKNIDIKKYDVIYFRRFEGDLARAMAVSIYAEANGVQILDSEIMMRKDSVNKLTQYMRMSLNGIPIPTTYVTSHNVLLDLAKKDMLPIAYPAIFKKADATRGDANELITSSKEALTFIKQYDSGEIIVQEFIDNVGDYRVWVLGDSLGPVFYRQRSMDTHKNNTSQGGSIEHVTSDSEIAKFENIAISAAKLFNREIAGVDIVCKKDSNSDYRVFEVNRSPQLENTPLQQIKSQALSDYLHKVAHKKLRTYYGASDLIGVSTYVDFAGYKNLKSIPARVDSGARTSSLWASDIKIKGGTATFKLFGPSSPWYTGKVVKKKVFGYRDVTSSTGHTEKRCVVKLSVKIKGKRLSAKFTLSDRATQVYPILIGRNTLRANFLVNTADPGEAKLYKYPEEADEFYERETI